MWEQNKWQPYPCNRSLGSTDSCATATNSGRALSRVFSAGKKTANSHLTSWAAAEGGGAKRIAWIWGGKRTAESALQNHFWRPQKSGLVWSVPLSFKGNDRESPQKGGGKRIGGGGSENVFGEGFFAEFSCWRTIPFYNRCLGKRLQVPGSRTSFFQTSAAFWPASRIFRISFSALSAFCSVESRQTLAFLGRSGTLRIFRIFRVSGSNHWFRISDRPALFWLALGDREENCPISGQRNRQRILSCLWLS